VAFSPTFGANFRLVFGRVFGPFCFLKEGFLISSGFFLLVWVT